MTQYNKFIAATVGMILLVINEKVGINLGPFEPAITEMVLTVATPLAVYLIPNTMKANKVG